MTSRKGIFGPLPTAAALYTLDIAIETNMQLAVTFIELPVASKTNELYSHY